MSDESIKIYRLTKTENAGTRGARYFYEVHDGAGRRLAGMSDNRDFVAGIVGRHTTPGGVGYSLSLMTQTPANLGSNLTSGGKSAVWGIALIETVEVNGNRFPVHRAANGSLDARNPAVDWSELPKEFRAALPIEPFYTPRPNDDDPTSIGWVYVGDKCGNPGPGELYCERLAGHDGQCAAKAVDASLGVETWNRRPVPSTAPRAVRELAGRVAASIDRATPKPAPSADIIPPAETSVAAAFAAFLTAETSDGTTTITDVRQITRACRKLIAAVDLYASGLCEKFVAAIYEDDFDRGEDPGEPEPPDAEGYTADCHTCGRAFWRPDPIEPGGDCDACEGAPGDFAF